MSSILRRLGIRPERRKRSVPPIADIVAQSAVPVYGLATEVMDLRFRGFSYSADEVELLFQRPTTVDFAPGIRIGSRKADGREAERFMDMLIRSAAQFAALNFGTDKLRATAQPFLHDQDNPFALLDTFPLSGTNEFVALGDGWQGSVLVWQWKLPQPLRAMAIGTENPVIIASYDLTNEQLLLCLENVVPINDRPELIAGYQAAFDERRRARHEEIAE
jgi:hypothetical protein